MSQIYNQVREVLSSSFVYSEDVAEVLSLGIAGGKNVLIFGPGGHAKSEMVQAVIDGLELENETFFQFFGEGMSEDRLFGGLNFAKLESEKVLEYYPERSFLNCRIAVFEELFDAPANVLLALKDTLTARELRNGAQRFQMRTEVIIVLTNKNPDEISDLGPAAHALVERFPLQLNLKWANYSADSYLALFKKVEPTMAGPYMNGHKSVLAELVAKATSEGNFVSPRTAVHAYGVVQAAAGLRGSNQVQNEDFESLRFVPGLESLGESVKETIADAQAKAEANELLSLVESELQSLERELEASETPIRALVVAKRFIALGDEVSGLRVHDEFVQRRNGLRDRISKKVSEAQAKALSSTRVEDRKVIGQ